MTYEEKLIRRYLIDEEYSHGHDLIAVKVGYKFILIEEYAMALTNLIKDGRAVNVQGRKYSLYKGKTYKDSRRIEFFMDDPKRSNYNISDYVVN